MDTSIAYLVLMGPNVLNCRKCRLNSFGVCLNWMWYQSSSASFFFSVPVHPLNTYDDVIKWKYFPRYWTFVRGSHRSTLDSYHKGQWDGALMFSLICAWINYWTNNRVAGDLIRQHVHYDVIVMGKLSQCQQFRASTTLHRPFTHMINNVIITPPAWISNYIHYNV